MTPTEIFAAATALVEGTTMAALVTALTSTTDAGLGVVLAVAIGLATTAEKLAPVSTVGYL